MYGGAQLPQAQVLAQDFLTALGSDRNELDYKGYRRLQEEQRPNRYAYQGKIAIDSFYAR